MIDKEILRKYNLHPTSYYKNKNAIIVKTDNQKLVFKKKTIPDTTLKYLKTRSFNYFPDRYDLKEDQYEIWQYLEDYDIPKEEKIKDLVNILSLLHLKTTTYEKINEDNIKEQYETLKTKINNLKDYYTSIDNQALEEIYPSPSHYLLQRNISKIYSLLNYCNNNIDIWYEQKIKEQRTRKVQIHNNIDLNHLIINERSYLISWNKSTKASPIYDLIQLYKKYYMSYDMESLFNQYEHNYPLTKSERIMFFLLISIPEEITFTTDEYQNTKKVSNLLKYIYKTDKFLSPYYNSHNQIEEK